MSNLTNPGVYFDVPDADYRAIPAISQSELKAFAKNPKAWKYGLPEREDTDFYRWGDLVETLLLQPAKFGSRYTVLDQERKEQLTREDNAGVKVEFSKRLGLYQAWKKRQIAEGKDPEATLTESIKADIVEGTIRNQSKDFSRNSEAFQRWATHEKLQGRTIIDAVQNPDMRGQTVNLEDAQLAADRCREEPNIDAVLQMGGYAQVACVWVDPDTEQLCKGLIDWLPKGLSSIMDIKTSRDICGVSQKRALYKFMGHARELGYHWQAGAYLYGYAQALEQSGQDPDPRSSWLFGVSGNVRPFPAAAYQLSQSDIEKGLGEYLDALKLWKRCHETGDFPGLTDDGFQELPSMYKS